MPFTQTQPDFTWLGGSYVPLAADWVDLDTKISRAVNGREGGTWNPGAPIDITGFSVTGETLVAYGGTLEAPVVINEPDVWPEYAAGHVFEKREILHSMLPRRVKSQKRWLTTSDGAIQSVAFGVQPTDRSVVNVPSPVRIDLEVHDGARLTSAIFTFRVPELRDDPPFAPPKFRICRMNANGAIDVLASNTLAPAGDGYQEAPKAGSPDVWYALGLAQTFEYVCDQNNLIDVSSYTYFAQVVEETIDDRPVPNLALDGNIRREEKLVVKQATNGVLAALSGVAALVDGLSVVAGDRVLVKDGVGVSTNYYLNGIYIVAAGAWTRAPDADAPEEFTPGHIIQVQSGLRNRFTFWEGVPSYPTVISATSSTGGLADIHYQPLTPRGNKYHSILLKFDGITHMKFQ